MLKSKINKETYVKKLRTNQAGIAHLAVVLVILVIAAVGFVGWRVFQNKNNNQLDSNAGVASTPSQNQITNDSNNVTKIEDEWTAFSFKTPKATMKIPDGWKLNSLSGETLYSLDANNLVYKEGTRATITEKSEERGLEGDAGAIQIYLNPVGTLGTKQETSLTTANGNEIEKYVYVSDIEKIEGLGQYIKGTTVYVYGINVGANDPLKTVYVVAPGKTDNSKYVEMMLATFRQ